MEAEAEAVVQEPQALQEVQEEPEGARLEVQALPVLQLLRAQLLEEQAVLVEAVQALLRVLEVLEVIWVLRVAQEARAVEHTQLLMELVLEALLAPPDLPVRPD